MKSQTLGLRVAGAFFALKVRGSTRNVKLNFETRPRRAPYYSFPSLFGIHHKSIMYNFLQFAYSLHTP